MNQRVPDEPASLTTLGLGEIEARIYRLLVGVRDSTVAEVTEWLVEDGTAVAVDEVARLLSGLVERGAVLVSPGPDGDVFRASPPGVALEPLLAERREQLALVEADIGRLRERYEASQPPRPDGPIEVVSGREAIRHRFMQVQLLAREELIGFTPLFGDPAIVSLEDDAAEREAMRRGVRIRVVLERGWFDHGRGQDVVDAARAGQVLHVVEKLPMQMLIADQRVAMLPIQQLPDGEPAAMVVHDARLVAAFVAMWTAYRDRGWPVSITAPLPVDDGAPDDVDRALLGLLHLGLTDESIAREVGMGTRSVQRRLRRLMDLAGARTRFQLGCHAVAADWLTVGPRDRG